MVSRVNTVAAEFRKVSNKQMAETTKRTIRENVSIMAQLVQKSDKTMELIGENDELKGKEKKQKQHINMLEDNEKELAKKNHSNQKVNFAYSFIAGLKKSEMFPKLDICVDIRFYKYFKRISSTTELYN